jgi:hypothetical protein
MRRTTRCRRRFYSRMGRLALVVMPQMDLLDVLFLAVEIL